MTKRNRLRINLTLFQKKLWKKKQKSKQMFKPNKTKSLNLNIKSKMKKNKTLKFNTKNKKKRNLLIVSQTWIIKKLKWRNHSKSSLKLSIKRLSPTHSNLNKIRSRLNKNRPIPRQLTNLIKVKRRSNHDRTFAF